MADPVNPKLKFDKPPNPSPGTNNTFFINCTVWDEMNVNYKETYENICIDVMENFPSYLDTFTVNNEMWAG